MISHNVLIIKFHLSLLVILQLCMRLNEHFNYMPFLQNNNNTQTKITYMLNVWLSVFAFEFSFPIGAFVIGLRQMSYFFS